METDHSILPTLPKDEYFYISPEGLNKLVKEYDPKEPGKNILWTTDRNCELPIIMNKNGVGKLKISNFLQ